MMNDDIKFELIKKGLSKIISNIIWIATLDAITLAGMIQKARVINIGLFEIPFTYIGSFMIIALLLFTISTFKKHDSILTLFKSIESNEIKEQIRFYLNSYPSILNPFSEHINSKSERSLDVMSVGIHTFLYLIGVSIALNYFIISKTLYIVLQILIFLLFMGFRTDLIHTQKDAISEINSKMNHSLKKIVDVLFILLYIVLAFFIIK